MAYERREWQTGDTITAAALNNIEDGIEEAKTLQEGEISNEYGVARVYIGYIPEGGQNLTFDISWVEVGEQLRAGNLVILGVEPTATELIYGIDYILVNQIDSTEDTYTVAGVCLTNSEFNPTIVADSTNGSIYIQGTQSQSQSEPENGSETEIETETETGTGE